MKKVPFELSIWRFDIAVTAGRKEKSTFGEWVFYSV
jgi:hypothetical protein